ncbi:glucose-6-phosphate isomerase [Lasius niger]|uniref:Glucose-6-phosphate isomerase n=1 Tax=Lasius niger TaxID=67767 RepID=A0A0J7KUB0_LASNI|nr:glucose-6-phosphate isomerase [Lasius niger]
MNTVALRLKKEVDVLLVIGIGGSYLGARAAIEMVQGLYNKKMPVEIIYVGNTLSSTYTAQLLEYLTDKEFAINVISKSGTTTEPAIAFRLFKDLMIKKQKKSKEIIKNRIIVTTDSKIGILHDLAKEEGYQTFIIPNDIGGRYSVLAPVGIFPMLVSDMNVDKVLIGAQKAYQECKTDKILVNPAYKYADLTKEYGPNTGCFDVSLTINQGEVYGFIGPNGAGKSTVIKQMVGFIKSDHGSGTILGYDV